MAVAVAAAAIVVLAGLYALGLPPFSNPAAGDVAHGDTSSQAIASAAAEAPKYGPGPWHTMLVSGADPYLSVLESTAIPTDTFSFAGDGSCLGHPESGNGSAVSFTGFDGDLSAGQAPSWLVVEMNATGSMLWTLVINGQALPVEFFTGPACALFELIGTLPQSAVNSSTAASAAARGGLIQFANAHPHGWTTYDAADLTGAGEWQVEYSTCPAAGKAPASTTYYTFLANVSLATGALIGSPSAGVASACGGLNLAGPIQSAASLGASSPWEVQGWGPSITQFMSVGSTVNEGSGVQYSYSVTVTAASGQLTWDDLVFSILNASNQVPRGPYFVAMYDPTGCIIAEGALDDPFYGAPLFGGGCSGSLAGQAPISSADTITIDSTVSVSGAGNRFVIRSANLDFSGSFTIPVP